MADAERQVIIAARYDEIRLAAQSVAAAARAVGLDEQGVYHCQLSVDEICANIIEHGYGGEDAARDISVVCCVRGPGCLIITISDSAPPFDPVSFSSPHVPEDPTQRQPGGWGVFFVKQLMDEVSYRYEQGRNWLTLVKCRPAEPAQLA